MLTNEEMQQISKQFSSLQDQIETLYHRVSGIPHPQNPTGAMYPMNPSNVGYTPNPYLQHSVLPQSYLLDIRKDSENMDGYLVTFTNGPGVRVAKCSFVELLTGLNNQSIIPQVNKWFEEVIDKNVPIENDFNRIIVITNEIAVVSLYGIGWTIVDTARVRQLHEVQYKDLTRI